MSVDLGPGSISDGSLALSSAPSREGIFDGGGDMKNVLSASSGLSIMLSCAVQAVYLNSAVHFAFVSAFKREQDAPETGFIDQYDEAASLTVSYHRFLSCS